MTSETGESGVARPWLIQERRLPSVTRPTRRFDEVGDAVLLEEAARTGSWSKPFSRMVSMASEQWVLAVTVVMGLRRRVRTVALPKGDLSADWDMESRRRWEGMVGDGGLVEGGVGGSRSLAASQSSSANYSRPVSQSHRKSQDGSGKRTCFAQITSDTVGQDHYHDVILSQSCFFDGFHHGCHRTSAASTY